MARGDGWMDRGGHLWPKDREVRTDDGTIVRYAVRGRRDAPVVVCCAGYLCPDNFWRDVGPDLARDHRVIVPNYRGVGASSEAEGGAKPPHADAYRLERLADDVAAVLDAEEVEDATAIGHSMGVQVALQLWRARPELVGALALLAGPFSSPLHTFYGNGAASYVFPFVSTTVAAMPRKVAQPFMRALELPITLPVARFIRALGPHTPDEGMRDYRWHLSNIDPRTAIWTARGMHLFDARPWLDTVDVPVFMAVGTADAWCPVRIGEELADHIRDVDLLIVPEGSHALPIEFPEVLLPGIRALTDR